MLVALFLACTAGCTHVDVKGREAFRVGPLRDVVVAPLDVDPSAVDIDAGTDALTDDEVAALATALPAALASSCDALASERGARKIGRARITGCKLRAGAGRKFTVYEARCKVELVVEGVAVIEVHGEGLVRTGSRAISQDAADEIKKAVRNPLLSASDSERALRAALDAAARLIVDGALPPREDGPPLVAIPRAQRAELARARLARDSNPRAGLFDLRSSGLPADALLVLPFLAYDDVTVRAEALDALGELCAPVTREKIEPLALENADNPVVVKAAQRALARIAACEAF